MSPTIRGSTPPPRAGALGAPGVEEASPEAPPATQVSARGPAERAPTPASAAHAHAAALARERMIRARLQLPDGGIGTATPSPWSTPALAGDAQLAEVTRRVRGEDGAIREGASPADLTIISRAVRDRGGAEDAARWFGDVRAWARRGDDGEPIDRLNRRRIPALTEAARATNDEAIRYGHYRETFNQLVASEQRPSRGDVDLVNAAGDRSREWNVGPVYLPGAYDDPRSAAVAAMERFDPYSVHQNREYGGPIELAGGRYRIAAPEIGNRGDDASLLSTSIDVSGTPRAAWHTHGTEEDPYFSSADKALARAAYQRLHAADPGAASFPFFLASASGAVHLFEYTPSMGPADLQSDRREALGGRERGTERPYRIDGRAVVVEHRAREPLP